MDEFVKAPDTILVEFLTASATPVKLLDLGPQFLSSMGLSSDVSLDRAFRVAVEKKKSKAGNAYYEYSQNGVPLPDGLNSFIRVEGAVVPFGKTHPSKTHGYPTREGIATIIVGNIPYEVTVYLTEGRTPYFIKVVSHRKPNRSEAAKKAQLTPRGGKLI